MCNGVNNGPRVGRPGHNFLVQEIFKVGEGARRLRKTSSLAEISPDKQKNLHPRELKTIESDFDVQLFASAKIQTKEI